MSEPNYYIHKCIHIICIRQLGYDPDGHNCYLSAVEVETLSKLDLVFDDEWSVYESYLADYCPDPGYSPPSPGGDLCHSRERIGYKISSYSVSASYKVASVGDCSAECQRDQSCDSFSYRYKIDPHASVLNNVHLNS